MGKNGNYRPAFTILGFVFGMAAGCFALSNAIISLLIILNGSFASGGLSLSISSMISVVLCIIIAILGILLIRGSLMVWRLSILGGAVNLVSGIVLTTLVYALFTISGNMLGQFYFISMVETFLMSIFSILSGCLVLVALFGQVARRFSPQREIEQKSIKVAVTLPSGSSIQLTSKADATVSDLRKQIVEKEGEDFANTVIIFQGKKVANEAITLKELGIKDGDKITLV